MIHAKHNLFQITHFTQPHTVCISYTTSLTNLSRIRHSRQIFCVYTNTQPLPKTSPGLYISSNISLITHTTQPPPDLTSHPTSPLLLMLRILSTKPYPEYTYYSTSSPNYAFHPSSPRLPLLHNLSTKPLPNDTCLPWLRTKHCLH